MNNLYEKVRKANRLRRYWDTRANNLLAKAKDLRGKIAQAKGWMVEAEQAELAKTEAALEKAITKAREQHAEYDRLMDEAFC